MSAYSREYEQYLADVAYITARCNNGMERQAAAFQALADAAKEASKALIQWGNQVGEIWRKAKK